MNDTLITIILWCGAFIGILWLLPWLFVILVAVSGIFISAYDYISSFFTRK